MIVDLKQVAVRVFFPDGVKVCLLPSGKHPRLFFEDRGAISRWRAAAFYPAFTRKAKVLRAGLRAAAFFRVIPRVEVRDASGAFAQFMLAAGLDGCNAVVMVGTPGAGQKLIAQVWQGQVLVGYLKFTLKESARKKLAREAEMLAALPEGLGPQLMKSDSFAGGDAVLITPVPGETAVPKLPVTPEALGLLEQMPISEETFSFDEHPWIQEVFGKTLVGDPLFDVLRNKQWPPVLMHGDFAPWNLIQRSEVSLSAIALATAGGQRTEDGGRRSGIRSEKENPGPNAQCPGPGSLCAIDWENGFLRGFPGVDHIHYILQVCLHVERRNPDAAGIFAVNALCEGAGYSAREASSLVVLCARWLLLRDCSEGNDERNDAWYNCLINSLKN